MKYELAKEIIDRLHELKELETLYYNMSNVEFNVETTTELLLKSNLEATKQKEIYTKLYNSIKQSQKNIEDTLKQISLYFNDTEEEVFVLYFLQNKRLVDIASELNMSYDFIRHVIIKLKKSLEEEFREDISKELNKNVSK